MPPLYSTHRHEPELEAEFAEIWRILDSLALTVQWALRRLETIEKQLGIEPEPPPGDGATPSEWPT